MEYKISKEKSEVTVKFVATETEWKDAEVAAYNKTKGSYRVPGFRAGKAPKHMIEQMYGAGVFMEDTMDELVQKGYELFLSENETIVPIAQPGVKIDELDTKALKFTLTFPVMPEIKLGEYKGIKIPKIEYNVTDEQVEAEINRIAERSAKIEEKDDAAVSGDTLNLDYSGSVDGVKFDGGTAEKQTLVLGSNTFIPGFEDQLIGTKKGDEKNVEVTFPETYHAENLKGKKAVFACKVNSVSKKVTPVIDDAWAKEVSEFDNLADYKASIKANLVKTAENKTRTEKENAIINAITDASEADVPEVLIQEYLGDMLKDMEMRLYYQGMRLEDYFKYMGTSEEDFRKTKHDDARRGALTKLCIEEIIKKESIQATDEEAEKKYAESMPEPKEGEEKRKPDDREMSYLKNQIVMDKLLDMLVSSAVEDDTATAEAKPAKATKTASTTKKAKSTKAVKAEATETTEKAE